MPDEVRMKAVDVLQASHPGSAVAASGAALPAEGALASVFAKAIRSRRLPTPFGWFVLLGALVNVAVVTLLFGYWLVH